MHETVDVNQSRLLKSQESRALSLRYSLVHRQVTLRSLLTVHYSLFTIHYLRFSVDYLPLRKSIASYVYEVFSTRRNLSTIIFFVLYHGGRGGYISAALNSSSLPSYSATLTSSLLHFLVCQAGASWVNRRCLHSHCLPPTRPICRLVNWQVLVTDSVR